MSARERLFELAVTRALEYRLALGPRADLSEWQSRTRFTSRVNLKDVLKALSVYPESGGPWRWEGGPDGAWRPGPPVTP